MPPTPEKRDDVVSAKYNLAISQKWSINGTDRDDITLEVKDDNGDLYVMQGKPDLMTKLLRRIANADCKPGWKFNADWYPDRNVGVITGPL